MKLFATVIDYPVKKVLATAALAGVKVEAILVGSQELQALSADASTMCLEDDAGVKTANILPVLKAVAAAQGSGDLLGGADAASVDTWLEFTWTNIGKFLTLTDKYA